MYGELKQENFQKQLEYGKEFEDEFARYLMNKGWFVVPKYLYVEEGAPSMFGKYTNYVLPDLDCSKDGERIWVECKRKEKMKKHDATGFSQRLHMNYKRVQEITGDKVFVVFRDDLTNETYGNWLSELENYVYRDSWNIAGDTIITFKYPEAFKVLNMASIPIYEFQ